MHGNELLVQIIFYLAAALVAVPIARRLGVGSVLGYLAAGVAVGPAGLDLVADTDALLHFAEMGVVMLLFVIGLELQPQRLWVMRRAIFLQGGLQVLVTTLVIGALAAWILDDVRAGAIIGFALSLSSTAFVLQTLAERKQLTSAPGRASFGILLFQDLAIIPGLAALPFIAGVTDPDAAAAPWWVAVLTIAGVLAGGHFGLRPLLRMVAATGIHELFTAATLLLVLGSAELMMAVGLSAGLGAFLAGVLVADSEFRHQLETDVEPFKGLLLGLFFMAVGMSVDLALLAHMPLLVLSVAAALLVVKVGVLMVLGVVSGARPHDARSTALFLAQGGEFAFVLLGQGAAVSALGAELADLLVLAVILSMVATPLLFSLDGWLRRRGATIPDVPAQVPDDVEHEVVIAGFGRFGQVVGRLLSMSGVAFTAIEPNPLEVDFVRRYGHAVFYGDPRRLDVLKAAHVDRARMLVIATDDVEASIAIAAMVREAFPDLEVLARVRNRSHAFHMRDLGVKLFMRDTFLSALEAGGIVLDALGMADARVDRAKRMFRSHDMEQMEAEYALHRSGDDLIQSARAAATDLRHLFAADAQAGLGDGQDGGSDGSSDDGSDDGSDGGSVDGADATSALPPRA